MFIVAIILIVVGFVIIKVMKPGADDTQEALKFKAILKKVFVSASFVLGFIFILASILRIISPGHVGVQVLWGKVMVNQTLSEGLKIVNPFVRVEQMSVRLEEYTMSIASSEGRKKGDDAITSLTKDGLQIALDLTVWYRLDSDEAATVYQKIGMNYDNKILRPAARTAIRDAASNYLLIEVYSEKRAEVALNIKELLVKSIGDKGIIIEEVLLRNVALPPTIKGAIDDKLAAEQEAQKMKFVLQKEEQEADRKRIEAEGIAKANGIIANSLTSRYLQWYYIQTLGSLVNSPNNTIIMTPFDQKLTPLISIPSGSR